MGAGSVRHAFLRVLPDAEYREKHPGYDRASNGKSCVKDGVDSFWVDVMESWKADVALMGHELWHIHGDYGNEAHHPWWHFCVPALVPIRFFFWPCEDSRLKAWTKEFMEKGEVVLDE